MIVIDYEDVHESASLDRSIASPAMLVIAVQAGGAGTEDEAVQAKLNPYMASLPKAFAALAI